MRRGCSRFPRGGSRSPAPDEIFRHPWNHDPPEVAKPRPNGGITAPRGQRAQRWPAGSCGRNQQTVRTAVPPGEAEEPIANRNPGPEPARVMPPTPSRPRERDRHDPGPEALPAAAPPPCGWVRRPRPAANLVLLAGIRRTPKGNGGNRQENTAKSLSRTGVILNIAYKKCNE